MPSRRVFLIGAAISVSGCASPQTSNDGFDAAPMNEGICREYAGRFGEIDRAAFEAGRAAVAELDGNHEERSVEQIAAAYSGMVLEYGNDPVIHYWRYAGRIVVWPNSTTSSQVYVRSEAMRLGAPPSEADQFVQRVLAEMDARLGQ